MQPLQGNITTTEAIQFRDSLSSALHKAAEVVADSLADRFMIKSVEVKISGESAGFATIIVYRVKVRPTS